MKNKSKQIFQFKQYYKRMIILKKKLKKKLFSKMKKIMKIQSKLKTNFYKVHNPSKIYNNLNKNNCNNKLKITKNANNNIQLETKKNKKSRMSF